MSYGLLTGNYLGLASGLQPGEYLGKRVGLFRNMKYIYQAETVAWYRQLALPKPSNLYVAKVDILIRGLKEFGIWNQLDRFWIFASEQQSHARVSIVNPKGINSVWPTNITEVSNPKWTRCLGYTGDGSSSYLNTNYNSSTNAVNAGQNSTTIGVYNRINSNPAVYNTDMGAYDGTNGSLMAGHSLTSMLNYLNSSASASVTVNNLLSLYTSQRNNSTTESFFQRGVLITASAMASSALPNASFYLLAQNQGGTAINNSPRQLSMAFIGSGNINQTIFFTIFQTFAKEIGFYVQ